MNDIEKLDQCAEKHVENASETDVQLLEAAKAIGRVEPLSRLASIESKTPEEILERRKDISMRQREAVKKNEPFMPGYTQEVREEAVRLGQDPSEYAALRTKVDINFERLELV